MVLICMWTTPLGDSLKRSPYGTPMPERASSTPSFADNPRARVDVRSAPRSGHQSHAPHGLLWATFGLMHCSKDSSFDHLVGSHLHRQRHREAKRLRGLEIDEVLEFLWLLHRKIGWFFASEDAVEIGSNFAEPAPERRDCKRSSRPPGRHQ